MPSPGAGPLVGKRILVTRASGQAGELGRLLSAAGATAVALPAIRFEPPASWAPCDRAASDLPAYDWVVFTSANGVRGFFERLAALGTVFPAGPGPRVAAIGPGTAAALGKYGVRPDLLPGEQVAEALAQALSERGLAGARVLLARAAEGRETLPHDLARFGATVDEVAVYRTLATADAGARLETLLRTNGLDAITFASSSAVRSVVAMLGEDAAGQLSPLAVACIGPVTARTAGELGLRVDVVPAEHTVAALVQALGEYFQGPQGRERDA